MSARQPRTIAAINRLLRPRSIAIVGASATPGALGHSVLLNLERAAFPGSIHLINPRRVAIRGRSCLKSIADLPNAVDVAILAIPRAAVLESVRALAERAVGAAIVFSAGFAEGGAEGLAEQRELECIAADSGMVIEGPNCLGSINFVDDVPLTFVEMPQLRQSKGPRVGIVSQSGAMAAVVAVTLMGKELPLSFFISTGNEAATGIEDYIEFLIADEATRAIALIAEQIRDPRRFQELARRALAADKPVVLLHPGRSAAGRASAATHTGAMAGDYSLMRVLVERAGVVVAHSLEELGDIVELAIRCGPLRKGAGVLCESGAFKALTLDVAEEIGLKLPPMTEQNSPELRAALPEFVPVSNPVDLTAQALVDPDLYRRTLQALLGDERLGVIVFCIIQTDENTAARKFPHIVAAVEGLQPRIPVVFAGVDEGAIVPKAYLAALRERGVPYFPTADRAFRAIARWQERSLRDFARAPGLLPAALPELPAPGPVPEYRSKEWLAAAGVPFPKGRFVQDLAQARAAAAAIGWPVALKAQSAELSHKSDAGGVILGVDSDAALAEGWEQLHSNIGRHAPGVRLDGVLIEAMCRRGAELIVGGRNDSGWGPALLVGFGGVTAEVFRDVRLLPHDLTRAAIVREIHRLESGALLRGFRGAPALDVEAMAEIVIRVGAVLATEPRIVEVDLNPVIVFPAGEGAIALDALMVVAPE